MHIMQRGKREKRKTPQVFRNKPDLFAILLLLILFFFCQESSPCRESKDRNVTDAKLSAQMFPAQKFTGCPNSPALISLLFYISGSIPAEGKWSSRKMGMQVNIYKVLRWNITGKGCAATVPNLQNKFPLKNDNKLIGSIPWFNWIMVLVGFKRIKKAKMIWDWKQNSQLRQWQILSTSPIH